MELTTNQTIYTGETMGQDMYKVKIPALAAALGLNGIDLVRLCVVSTTTAYKAVDENAANELNLDSCWKIYTGLRKSGKMIDGREIRWSDIVDIG